MDRNNVWAPVGLDLVGAKNVDEALKMAELDFTVDRKMLFDEFGKPIPGYFMNRRSDNGAVLGIVTGKYNIVQNIDAFNFIDGLVAEGLEFEKGGVWHNGSAVWLEAKLPGDYKILGDDVESHVLFTNAHNGKGAVQVCLMPTRLFCSNQIVMALKGAQRKWSMIHSSKVEIRMAETAQVITASNDYMNVLNLEMEKLAKKSMTRDDFQKIVDETYPIITTDSNRKQTNAMEIRTALMSAYDMPDLENFNGTAYKAIQSVADYASHRLPQRATKEFYDARFEKLAAGDPDADKLYARIMAA